MTTEFEREIVALQQVGSEILFIYQTHKGGLTLVGGEVLMSADPEIEIVAAKCDSPEDALFIYEQLGRQLGFVANSLRPLD